MATSSHDAQAAGADELDTVRTAYPRGEREKALPYARRLNLISQQRRRDALVNGQPLTLPQLASLSGAPEPELRRDPQLKALPLELVPVREAFPRGDGEKALPYARRLNQASQQKDPNALVNGQTLTVSQLASLSGANETRLRQTSDFKVLPLELEPVRAAFPRHEDEKALPYARRLNLASQQCADALVDGQPLTLPQLASLSGANLSQLRRDPQLKALPPELEPVRAAFPRRNGEKALPYARRLNQASALGDPDALVDGQPLALSQLASLSGATEHHLQLDSQLQELPPELTPVRAAFPRREGEAAAIYARRLHQASEQRRAGALVNGQPLTLSQLASLSGANESILRQDSQLKPLPAELEPVRAAFPHREREKALHYARRLNLASQQKRSGALVNGQTLTLSQLGSLSGAKEADLRKDPQLKALPLELAPVRAAFPRREGEKALHYARRLNEASQQGNPYALVNNHVLTLSQLASLSGAKESDLREDPQLKPLPLELTPVRAAFPRGQSEKAMPYARRLNLVSQRKLPGALVNGRPLTLSQLSSLSGAKESQLQLDPQLKPLPLELASVRAAFPRREDEKGLPYARRLNLASRQRLSGALVHGQTLTLPQLASLSGVMESELRRDPQLKALPTELAPVRAAFPRREGEKALPYARRLNLASQSRLPGARVNGQPLTVSQLASLSGAKESQLRQDLLSNVLPVEPAPVQSGFPRE